MQYVISVKKMIIRQIKGGQLINMKQYFSSLSYTTHIANSIGMSNFLQYLIHAKL